MLHHLSSKQVSLGSCLIQILVIGCLIPGVLIAWFVLQQNFASVTPLSIDVALVALLAQLGLAIIFATSAVAAGMSSSPARSDRNVYIVILGCFIAVAALWVIVLLV